MQDRVKQIFHEYAKETGGPTEAAAILTLAHILETEFDRRRPPVTGHRRLRTFARRLLAGPESDSAR